MPTHDTWPIAGAMLQFPAVGRDGSRVQDAGAEQWTATLAQVAGVGFDRVEVNDNWLRIGDLSAARVDELAQAGRASGIRLSSVCVVRSSVIDPVTGGENLAYTHRTLDAAARLGAEIVSIGFHRPLTPAQRQRLWFWLAQGEVDDPDDADNLALAVARVRELGVHAAELGMDLSLEMYEDTYLGSAGSAVRMVQDVGLDNVGLNPDVGNLIRLHRPIDGWADILPTVLPYANYWHVKNYLRDEDPATGSYFTVPAPLEVGLIDYRQAVHEAVAVGFRGHLVCEHYGGDGLGVSATNREYLRGVLAGIDTLAGGRGPVAGTGAVRESALT